MAVDPRQLVAGFLTLSMFVMVGNMIKRDHFDTIEVNLADTTGLKVDMIKVEEQKTTKISKVTTLHVKDHTTNQEINQCLVKPPPRSLLQSEGFVTFSLTSGPEYHISQVTDAVVIANYLGATLVVPNIRGNELGVKRKFQDMYDLEKFTTSLDGIVKVVNELPAEFASKKPTVIRVPNRVSEQFIEKDIKPIFQTSNYIHLSIVFPSISLKKRENQNKDLDLVACQAMFHSLELKTDITDVANRMVERLKILSRNNEGRFIAVDLRGDMLNKRSCKVIKGGRKSCYDASEIAGILKKLGHHEDSVIYLTETWWHDGLNPLKEAFPKTYTKDDLLPGETKGRFLKSGNEELQRALDFHICSNSDTFVPAISGLFYGNVAGRRIISSQTRILVPNQITGSSVSESDFISSYVSKQTHLAYSCMC